MIHHRRTTTALRAAIAQLKDQPINSTELHRAIRHHQQTGEFPAPGRMRDLVQSIVGTVEEMDRRSGGLLGGL